MVSGLSCPRLRVSCLLGVRPSDFWIQVEFIGFPKLAFAPLDMVHFCQGRIDIVLKLQEEFGRCPCFRRARPRESSGSIPILSASTPHDLSSPGAPRGARALKRAGLQLRFHDLRHTCIKTAEGQASEKTLMAIAGHVGRKMLEHYSHARMVAKRRPWTPSQSLF